MNINYKLFNTSYFQVYTTPQEFDIRAVISNDKVDILILILKYLFWYILLFLIDSYVFFHTLHK